MPAQSATLIKMKKLSNAEDTQTSIRELVETISASDEGEQSPLRHLRALIQGDYESILMSADESGGIETLFVSMGKLRDCQLMLRFCSLTAQLPPPPVDADPQPEVFHATLVLPFEVAPTRIMDFSVALHVINRLLPLCTFCLSLGTEGQPTACYLQCSFLLEPNTEELPAASLYAIFDMVNYALSVHAAALGDIAEGSQTSLEPHLSKLGISLVPVPLVRLPCAPDEGNL